MFKPIILILVSILVNLKIIVNIHTEVLSLNKLGLGSEVNLLVSLEVLNVAGIFTVYIKSVVILQNIGIVRSSLNR